MLTFRSRDLTDGSRLTSDRHWR